MLAKDPGDKHGLGEEHPQELNVCAVGIEQVEVVLASLGAEDETPDEGEEGDEADLVLLANLLL